MFGINLPQHQLLQQSHRVVLQIILQTGNCKFFPALVALCISVALWYNYMRHLFRSRALRIICRVYSTTGPLTAMVTPISIFVLMEEPGAPIRFGNSYVKCDKESK